jgi:hypothetical protein
MVGAICCEKKILLTDHVGGVWVADESCSVSRHLAWDNVDDDLTVRNVLLSVPLSGCGVVVFCCVRCLWSWSSIRVLLLPFQTK